MTDEQTQTDEQPAPAEPQRQGRQAQSDIAPGPVQHNDQSLPSMATWHAPWEDNINQPFQMMSEVERAQVRTAAGPSGEQPLPEQQPVA